jgi:hypothetical protein
MMFRRLFAAVLAAGLLLLIGAPAYAAPPVTETTTAKNVVDTFVDVGPPCEDGALYTVTTTTNLIDHTTVFDDGRIHATFTQSGTFVAVPLEDPSLPHRTPRRLGRLQRQRQSGERHLYLQHRRHRFGRLEVPPERTGAFQCHANGCGVLLHTLPQLDLNPTASQIRWRSAGLFCRHVSVGVL